MRIYYEVLEIVPVDQEPEFIRADVTDKTEAERAVILADIKDIMTGMTYILREHTHYHEEDKACTTRPIT